jgi:membrane protein YqaA with SNARE-associated domain
MHGLLVLVVSSIGTLGGSLANYYIAYFFGRKLFTNKGKYFFINQSKLEKIEKFFASHGAISVFTGRFLPGVKHFISFPAGLAKMNLKPFCLYTLLGGTIWCAVLISLGYVIVLAPAREHIESAILGIRCINDNISPVLLRNIIRTVIVLSTAFVAISTPYFGSILGIVGGLTDALQSFVLPPIIYMKLAGSTLSNTRNTFYKAVTAWGLCTIVFTIIKLSVMIVTYLSSYLL